MEAASTRVKLFAGVTTICAVLAIASAPWALAQPALNLVFKPLATLTLIAYAATRGDSQGAVRRWVLTGLVLSLAGLWILSTYWPPNGASPAGSSRPARGEALRKIATAGNKP